jgi:hypothetical protein
MANGREHDDSHVPERGHLKQVAHLCGHDLGRTYEAVERCVVNDAGS